MKRSRIALVLFIIVLVFLGTTLPTSGEWVTRDKRWQPRGPWNWALPRELPKLFREFNGIDFGHAHLAETLLRTHHPQQVEQARLEVLDFISSSPPVPPDDEQVAPTLVRMAWEVQWVFNWAHTFHRSLYDLFASDGVRDKEAAYRAILASYLEKPEAITPHRLDHHGRLWSFPESKSFRTHFGKFNTQIWAYHWLQAATYDLQLLGNAARQRALTPRLVEHYHGYLKNPPLEWQFMPMMAEGAPQFSRRFPEAAVIFDNLHMLHDNIDDVLSRPDLYPTLQARREAILRILQIYLHRNHEPQERYAEYHGMAMAGGQARHGMMAMGPRPPSLRRFFSARPRMAIVNNSHKPKKNQPATTANTEEPAHEPIRYSSSFKPRIARHQYRYCLRRRPQQSG